MKEEIFKIPLIFYCKLIYHYLTSFHNKRFPYFIKESSNQKHNLGYFNHSIEIYLRVPIILMALLQNDPLKNTVILQLLIHHISFLCHS